MANTKSSNAYQYDAFISYSSEDKAFAERLEKVLENYRPPKDLDLPQRRLNVFRYEADMIGTKYYESIQEHLSNSAKVIAVCSPSALKSRYVNEELRCFAELNDPKKSLLEVRRKSAKMLDLRAVFMIWPIESPRMLQ